MDLGFTWFDVAALALIGLSALMAFARGLIRELFSIIAFIGGGLAGYFFHGLLKPTVESVTGLNGGLAAVASGLLIFLIVFVGVTLVTSAIAKNAHQSTEIGSFDRAAGLAFGVLRGVFVVALLVMLLRSLDRAEAGAAPSMPMQDSIRGARTYPIYEGVAKALEAILPGVRERASDYIEGERARESAAIPPAEAEPAEAEAPAPN